METSVNKYYNPSLCMLIIQTSLTYLSYFSSQFEHPTAVHYHLRHHRRQTPLQLPKRMYFIHCMLFLVLMGFRSYLLIRTPFHYFSATTHSGWQCECGSKLTPINQSIFKIDGFQFQERVDLAIEIFSSSKLEHLPLNEFGLLF